MAVLVEERMYGLDGPRDEAFELDHLTGQVDLAARDARDIEKIVYQARQARELARNDIACPVELRIIDRLQAHQLDRVVDRSQRIAQLVGEHSQELILVAVGLLQRLFRP